VKNKPEIPQKKDVELSKKPFYRMRGYKFWLLYNPFEVNSYTPICSIYLTTHASPPLALSLSPVGSTLEILHLTFPEKEIHSFCISFYFSLTHA